MTVEISYDYALIEEIAARFDLREPNKRALDAVVRKIAEAGGSYTEMVADLATGVGKTFLMSSLVEYLAQQGVRNILIVTPGSTIQRKTLANFDGASGKYVVGADIEPFIVTPENFRAANVGLVLRDPQRLKVFIFNVQQLLRPTANASRKVRSEDENLGNALYDHLGAAQDLVVISDEHHVYHVKATAFSAAIRDLHPLALVGLTATPDNSDYGKIVFQYTLGEAIADGHVKVPVIVYRKDGTKDERTQLADACQLLRRKEASYAAYRKARPETSAVKPVLFVVCQSVEHAAEVGQVLASDGFIGDPAAVLEITSQSSDEALQALADVELVDSPTRAIVSVNMLREGWDVKNIAVIVALRKLASQTLTEQILGRGLRLPFGQRTGTADVDQVDLVAHDSYKQLLSQKSVLSQRIQLPTTAVEVDENGAATTTEYDPNVIPTMTPEQHAGPTPPVPSTSSDDAERDDPSEPPTEGVLFGLGANSTSANSAVAALGFQENRERKRMRVPEPRMRVTDAPQIVFPRREARLDYARFELSDIPDADARQAGARFVREVPTFIFRDAIEAVRNTEGDVEMFSTPQDEAEAQQPLAGMDVVHDDLIEAIMRFRQVPAERSSRNAAKRLVKAFLEGAGATSVAASAEWGQRRREQAVNGMGSLINASITNRKKEVRYELVPIILPVEPVLVDPDSVHNAHNDAFARNTLFAGWSRGIMPIASFDAKTTEWELASLLDRDREITWWLRLYTNGPAYVPTTDGNYFPDFIAVDQDGVRWLIEGKADKNANDADVQRKKNAAERWARAIRDNDGYGQWRYVFATESHIRQAGGSWNGLLVATNPE